MKKRYNLAVAVLCLSLGISACSSPFGTEDTASGSSRTEGTEKAGTETGQDKTGSDVRLVSVDNVKKYIKLADYKNLTLVNTFSGITDKMIDEEIEKSLLAEYHDPGQLEGAREKDLLTIRYLARCNGKVVDASEEYDLYLGSSNLHPDLDQGLAGMKRGETRKIELSFDENANQKEYAGSTVLYEVTLESILRPAELTDAWVAAHSEAKTVEEYRALVKQSLESKLPSLKEKELRNLAWDMILTDSEVGEFPQQDISNARDEFCKQILRYRNDGDMTLEEYVRSQGMTMERFEEECTIYAERKVKQNLIVQGIMDAEGLSLTDQDSLKIQDELIASYGYSSLVQMLDEYGQSMLDESIGYLRVMNFIMDNVELQEAQEETPASENDAPDEGKMVSIDTSADISAEGDAEKTGE